GSITTHYPAFAIDPKNPSNVLFATNVLHLSTDHGNYSGSGRWTALSQPNQNGWTSSARIHSFAVSPQDDNVVYAFSGGKFFRTSNALAALTGGTVTWQASTAQASTDPNPVEHVEQ